MIIPQKCGKDAVLLSWKIYYPLKEGKRRRRFSYPRWSIPVHLFLRSWNHLRNISSCMGSSPPQTLYIRLLILPSRGTHTNRLETDYGESPDTFSLFKAYLTLSIIARLKTCILSKVWGGGGSSETPYVLSRARIRRKLRTTFSCLN